MRVLTYNIHGWRGVDGRIDVARLARIIDASQADVVGLNEVFHPFTPEGADRPALDELAAALGMEAAFGVALAPQFAFAPLSAYGNALLTRYPLLAHAGHHLTPVDGHEQRGLLEARVLLPDGRTSLSIYVTHLDHLSEDVRLKQAQALLQWTVRDRHLPHLVIGDFNALSPADLEAQPDQVTVIQEDQRVRSRYAEPLQVLPRMLRAGYVDACAADATGQPAPTFPTTDLLVRIDYVLASRPLAVSLHQGSRWQTAETDLASDHLPVRADFAFPA